MEERRQDRRTDDLNTPVVARLGPFRLRAQLLDLAERGLRLRTTGALKEGDRLDLVGFRRGNREPIACQVVWCTAAADGYQVGLNTPDPLGPTWLGRLALARDQKTRGQARFTVPTQTQVSLLTTQGYVSGELVDIGLGGAQLFTEADLKPGDLLRLKVQNQMSPIAAVVARRQSDERQVLHLHFVRSRSSRLGLMRLIQDLAPDLQKAG